MKKIIKLFICVVTLKVGLLANVYISGTIDSFVVTNKSEIYMRMKKTNNSLTSYFKFDATGDGGKAIIASLLTAKTANLPVDVFFSYGTKMWTKIKFK